MEAKETFVVLDHSIRFVATQRGGRRRWKNSREFERFQLGANPLDLVQQEINLGEHLGLVINLRGVSVHLFITGRIQESVLA